MRRPTDIATSLAEYWATYNDQHGVDLYTQGIIIDDALYGLGIAIDPDQFSEADGYARFKDVLREHLKEQSDD